MSKPKLDPPCIGWLSDLPGPTNPPTVLADLGYDTPNHLDDIYLEMPRKSLALRGIIIWFAVLQAYFVFYDYIWTFGLFGSSEQSDFLTDVIGFGTIIVSQWSTAIFFRLDTSPPRDLPIRFNRARQRIYAYNFQYRWWNPFEHWRVIPVSYDWSQVRAERWKLRGVTAQGGLIIKCGVVLSIVKPGTNKVIDRFPLSTMRADEFAWAYICTYMQQGPSTLPPPGPPRDHNDVPWYNLSLRLAPKVRWPADMDQESRTAP